MSEHETTAGNDLGSLKDLERVLKALEGTEFDFDAATEDQYDIANAGIHLIATLLRKNKDYGSSVFKRPLLSPGVSATQGILVRLSDKLERLKQLEGRKGEVDESLLDTVKDTAGYFTLLYVAMSRGYEH